jgi:hypothetical protein
LLERATPPSTRYATKWTLKIFDSWRAARKVKEVKIDDAGHESWSSRNNLFEWSQFKRNRRNSSHFAEKKRPWNQALKVHVPLS